MSARADALADDATLSAYVNGSVPEPLRSQVARAVQGDPRLRDEYRQALKLRRALQQPLTPAPGDFGLDRLNRDIDDLQARRHQGNWRSRLRHLLQKLFGPES